VKGYIGIDIGSTATKAVVLDNKANILKCLVLPTGWSSVDAAQKVQQLLQKENINPEEYLCVATGYGRVAVPFAQKSCTEITCHAKGAMYLHNTEDIMVIDIGGQDTKIIQVEKGVVKDFVMNDKCSAGTGRFLEIMANNLALAPNELCALAANGGGTFISSMCTVFAESEVVSLIGRGEKKENIAFAVVNSIVKKVASQVSRINAVSPIVCLTGGLCECQYLCLELSKALDTDILASPRGRYAGAIGAALLAMQM